MCACCATSNNYNAAFGLYELKCSLFNNIKVHFLCVQPGYEKNNNKNVDVEKNELFLSESTQLLGVFHYCNCFTNHKMNFNLSSTKN